MLLVGSNQPVEYVGLRNETYHPRIAGFPAGPVMDIDSIMRQHVYEYLTREIRHGRSHLDVGWDIWRAHLAGMLSDTQAQILSEELHRRSGVTIASDAGRTFGPAPACSQIDPPRITRDRRSAPS